MCGIVGFIKKEERLDIIEEMLKIQAHRGPDDLGKYFNKEFGVNFGHNRLSIQDLSSHGHQPFISDCENYVIVFNGEVYNFIDLRIELQSLGYSFASSSDTEVILYSYKEWGISCIDKFVGMFAFSILDKINNKLLLVRDRVGVKPLYYYVNDKEFLFSSELKSFHKNPFFIKEENMEVLPYYFQFGYIPAPYTIFKNCFKLEAGHYLEYNLNTFNFTISKYWDIDTFYQEKKLIKSEESILSEIENILESSVNLRMVSDVPVGVFLSGGYDSSLVSAILSKKQKIKINTFTIGFDNPKYNEANHAKKIAEYLNTNHTEYYIKNEDMINLIEKLPFYYDEPFGDSSSIPTMIVSEKAKEKVKVVLSADGGDEIFCGYSKYFFLNSFQNIFKSKWKKEILKLGLNIFSENSVSLINDFLPKKIMQTNIKDKYSKFRRAINSVSLEEMFENASSYVDPLEVNKLLKIKRNEKVFSKWKKQENFSYLDKMMSTDFKLFMNDDVLTKVDRATMSSSIEGREPLLDHRISEYMAKVPISIKYKNKEGKYLLRQVLYKYLPRDLVDKPKSGFQIPLNDLLRTELKYLVDLHISREKLDVNIFNVDYILNLKNKFMSGSDVGTTIWFIFIYQMWKEKWID